MFARRLIVAALVSVLIAAALYAFSTLSAELPAIAAREQSVILIVKNPPALNDVHESFFDRMQELGYIQGSSAQYVEMDVSTDIASTREGIEEAIHNAYPDAIFVMGVLAARAAKEAVDKQGSNLPIVFGVVSDPVGVGLVRSLRSSGNNITGVTPANEIGASKRIEYLREMLPETKRVIFAWNDETTSGVANLRSAAAGLGLELVERQVANVQEATSFLQSFDFKTGDVIVRASDGVGAGSLPDILRVGLEKKIPIIGTNSGDTRRGALMSFGADYKEIGKASARLFDLVLRGTAPSAIPVEEASRFEIAVNLNTAKSIDVRVPQSFLLKTNFVVPAN